MSVDILSRPLRVGTAELRNRVLMAPMSGVSDLPMRNLALAHGAGAVVLGCAGMAPMRAALEADLGVPVIDPAQAAVAMAGGALLVA